jgi:hypothetical protein
MSRSIRHLKERGIIEPKRQTVFFANKRPPIQGPRMIRLTRLGREWYQNVMSARETGLQTAGAVKLCRGLVSIRVGKLAGYPHIVTTLRA